MEKNKRAAMKAITWQLIGFVTMALINTVYMGSWHDGLGLSSVLTLTGLVSYYLHERAWARIHWGRS
jgi:uncharacterized membrane protein